MDENGQNENQEIINEHQQKPKKKTVPKANRGFSAEEIWGLKLNFTDDDGNVTELKLDKTQATSLLKVLQQKLAK